MQRAAYVLRVLVLALCAGCATYHTTKLLVTGDSRELRERPDGAPPNAPERPGILLLALDGVDRGLLYDMLRGGEMPAFARLLGGDGVGFPHAYFDESFVATLPSSTMVAWTTSMTGVAPARHGVAGNEFFIREQRRFAAPVPVTIQDSTPVIACYTEGYVNDLVLAPTVYERIRERDPNALMWVAMHQISRGADRLLIVDRTVLADAFEAFLEDEVSTHLEQKHSRAVYEKLDDEVVDVVVDELRNGPIPDVLTVYLSGTDSFAHVADSGPDAARRENLREVVDPLVARLTDALRARDALADRYVVVTSDHGHTEVVRDDAHALSMTGRDDPPAVLQHAGFRVRPFSLDVPEDDDFDTVLAYQGAMAFVYVADRSTCPEPGVACDWSRPPRFHEDVLSVADAFYRDNEDGSSVPAMRGVLDMVLTRKPRPVAADDLPFEVYVGDGRLVPIERYLRTHPHPTYVDMPARLRDLGVGPHGERAGDVILLAHSGDRETPEERYYFASRYRSWHGSPGRNDSEIPLIVANPTLTTSALQALVQRTLGTRPSQQKLTDLLLLLRTGDAADGGPPRVGGAQPSRGGVKAPGAGPLGLVDEGGGGGAGAGGGFAELTGPRGDDGAVETDQGGARRPRTVQRLEDQDLSAAGAGVGALGLLHPTEHRAGEVSGVHVVAGLVDHGALPEQ
jgi:hypothetical protein